jgi:hypothetical protein
MSHTKLHEWLAGQKGDLLTMVSFLEGDQLEHSRWFSASISVSGRTAKQSY